VLLVSATSTDPVALNPNAVGAMVLVVAFLLLILSGRLFRPMLAAAAEMVKIAVRAALAALLVTAALILLILSMVLRWH
jgi:hypothetical protein